MSSPSLLHEHQWVYLKHWGPKNYGNYGKFLQKSAIFEGQYLAGFPNSETYGTQTAGLCPKELLALV